MDPKVKLVSIIICWFVFLSVFIFYVVKCMIKEDFKLIGLANNYKIRRRIDPKNHRVHDSKKIYQVENNL